MKLETHIINNTRIAEVVAEDISIKTIEDGCDFLIKI
jgi:hypothetical protein